MNMHRNTMLLAARPGDCRGLKTMCAALLVALILVPSLHAQAEKQPPANATSVGREKGGSLYSLNFEGGSVNALKGVWMNAFTNDNFLITAHPRSVK